MSSYDRKLVHDMVAEAGMVLNRRTGRDRHIVIRSRNVSRELGANLSEQSSKNHLRRGTIRLEDRFSTGTLSRLQQTLKPLGCLDKRVARIWSRHVINSALLAEPSLVAQKCRCGKWAGLPGIPMAIAQPDAQFTLVEPMERRSIGCSPWLITLD